MSRFARKVDANQTLIVEALRKRGHLVQSIAAVGGGVPDLLVAKRGTRQLVLLELKAARNKRGDLEGLTPAESAFHAAWADAPVYVVGGVESAIAAVEGQPQHEVCW